MAHARYLRDKARRLRREKQLTIDDLAERLALSRSTIYYWVRDLPIPRPSGGVWPESARRKGNRAMQAKYSRLREAAYDRGRGEFTELAADPTFRDFICLFIAEGYRRSRHTVSIANSDPQVIQLCTRWIARFARNQMFFTVQHHADQSLDELRLFWADVLDVSPERIKFQRKSNSGKLGSRTWRCRYGVLTSGANDTLLRARLQGWVDCLKESWLDSKHLGA